MVEHASEQATAAELIAAHDRALREFAEALGLLHIDCGAPPRSDLTKGAKAAGRCTLPASSLTEVFQGRRLPKLDFTVELIRQLRPGEPELLDEWRERWRIVKRAEQKAAPARRALRAGEEAPGVPVPAARPEAAAGNGEASADDKTGPEPFPGKRRNGAQAQGEGEGEGESREQGEDRDRGPSHGQAAKRGPSRKAIASVVAAAAEFVRARAEQGADPREVMAEMGALLYQWLAEGLDPQKSAASLTDMPTVALRPGGPRTAMPTSLVEASGYAAVRFTPAAPAPMPVPVPAPVATVFAADERPWTAEEQQSGCPVCRTPPATVAGSWACDGCGSCCVRGTDGQVFLDVPRGRRPSEVNAYICLVCELLVHPIKMRTADCPRCGANLVPGALGRR
ncbi:hypothetical protein [Streptomyces sp. NPDC002564]|uniref:hypothetical protein n=1 Tax=Streptomyces sp. NPDC002564 TaxID=3364649 RepID=UPI0036C8C5BF